MKMYLISDNIDTLTGMRLAGIPGVVAHGKDELEAALTAAFADPDIGVLLLTEKFGRDFPEYVNRVKLYRHSGPARQRPPAGFHYGLCQ